MFDNEIDPEQNNTGWIHEPEVELEELNADDPFGNGKTLLIDGDILLYKPCCVFNEDTDVARAKTVGLIKRHINEMLVQSGCTSYQFFITTKTNFRDFIVDDYKANRKDEDRPVNLTFIKKWCKVNLNAIYEEFLEADDLLAIYFDETKILWSTDKDLRQLVGTHLDEHTRQLVEISGIGELWDMGKKVYFTGEAGFYLQMLTGDGADNIIGCGIRGPVVTKSGPNKGNVRILRQGVGPKQAIKIISSAVMGAGASATDEQKIAAMNQAVGSEYQARFGENFREMWENQANLLFMVRDFDKETGMIKRWTCDSRDEYMNIKTGQIFTDEHSTC